MWGYACALIVYLIGFLFGVTYSIKTESWWLLGFVLATPFLLGWGIMWVFQGLVRYSRDLKSK